MSASVFCASCVSSVILFLIPLILICMILSCVFWFFEEFVVEGEVVFGVVERAGVKFGV